MRFLSRRIFIMVGLFLLFLIPSCVSAPASQNVFVPTPLGESVQQLPFVSTIEPTSTAQPTRTYIPTPTRMATNTQTITPVTPTLSETLEPTQAVEEIRLLLEHPQKCPLPCFWGIIPNQTTFGEANNIFQRIGEPFTRSWQGENIFFASPHFDGISMSVELLVDDEIVKSIKGRIGLENDLGPTSPRVWASFSPENILKAYGKPSNVEFNIYYPTEPGFPQGVVWYGMVMRFDHYLFAVDYFRGEVKQGKQIAICPLTDKFSVVDTYFGYNPDTYRSQGIGGMPLDKISSINMDEFYDLMTQGDNPACFTLNTEAYNNP